MSNKTKNIIIIVQSILLVMIIIVGGIYFIPRVINKLQSLQWSDQYISLNDNISHLEFYDCDNNPANFNDKNDKYKLIVFLSRDCTTCMSHIPILKRMNDTFCNDQKIELMLMWLDGIPDQEGVDIYGLDECSFSLNGVHIASSYNTVFLADENNNIIYTDTSNYAGILDKIIELNILDEEKLILNSNEYIKDNLAKNYSGKPDLIYFSMPGCPDCANANPIIYSDAITEEFHITRIELVKGAAQYDLKDEYNILRKIYKIDWYPSFLIIRNDGKWGIVRKVELDKMQNNILAVIK